MNTLKSNPKPSLTTGLNNPVNGTIRTLAEKYANSLLDEGTSFETLLGVVCEMNLIFADQVSKTIDERQELVHQLSEEAAHVKQVIKDLENIKDQFNAKI